MVHEIMAPVAPGELLDKITILELKRARINDASKRAHVAHELALLEGIARRTLPTSEPLDALIDDLREVNGALWDVEDALRVCERERDFGDKFVTLARSVYIHNDRRAAVKKEINLLLGSAIVEEKSYETY